MGLVWSDLIDDLTDPKNNGETIEDTIAVSGTLETQRDLPKAQPLVGLRFWAKFSLDSDVTKCPTGYPALDPARTSLYTKILA